VIGRENQKSAALARVDSSRSDIFNSHLPAIHDAAIQSTTFAGRWDLEHDRSRVDRVEERHRVNEVRVRRESLIRRVQEAGPVHDLVVPGSASPPGRLIHQLVVDKWHAPDDRLDSPPVQRAVVEIRGARVSFNRHLGGSFTSACGRSTALSLHRGPSAARTAPQRARTRTAAARSAALIYEEPDSAVPASGHGGRQARKSGKLTCSTQNSLLRNRAAPKSHSRVLAGGSAKSEVS
jgi:hypothetical protein